MSGGAYLGFAFVAAVIFTAVLHEWWWVWRHNVRPASRRLRDDPMYTREDRLP